VEALKNPAEYCRVWNLYFAFSYVDNCIDSGYLMNGIIKNLYNENSNFNDLPDCFAGRRMYKKRRFNPT
jgi:hypothetical protein